MELHKDVEHPIWVDRSFDEVMWNRVDSDDVHAWFERAMDDFPKKPTTGMWRILSTEAVEEWYKKWFGSEVKKT